ncbi:MAG: ABC transporter ATP-binding protein [Candidatus Fermentibacteraceae bacterium]
MTPESPISVEHLVRTFQIKAGLARIEAVKDVSFHLEPGEILGFLGHNGAGKTTTMKCVLGLLHPTSGKARVWGLPPGSSGARARLGYVPENPDYDQSFTSLELLRAFAGMRGLPGTDADWMKLLERVGLRGWETMRLKNYSKGMRQRLSLALALQSKPGLLILDEPTGGLDPIARKEFRDIILEENARGASIFLSSHLLSEVESVCNRVIILNRGTVVRTGTLEELLGGEETHRVSYLEGHTAREVTVPSDELQSTIDMLRGKGFPVTGVERSWKSLEEVFLCATEARS